jgi:hypothetical protein
MLVDGAHTSSCVVAPRLAEMEVSVTLEARVLRQCCCGLLQNCTPVFHAFWTFGH